MRQPRRYHLPPPAPFSPTVMSSPAEIIEVSGNSGRPVGKPVDLISAGPPRGDYRRVPQKNSNWRHCRPRKGLGKDEN